jgi:hypothetical protein
MSLRSAGLPLLTRCRVKVLFGHPVHQLMSVTFIATDLPSLKPEFTEPVQELTNTVHRIPVTPGVDNPRTVAFADSENRTGVNYGHYGTKKLQVRELRLLADGLL